MKILLFTVDCPFPPVSGGEIRNAANALALSAIGEVLTVSFSGAPAASTPPNIRHAVIEAARGRGPWQKRSDHPTVHLMPADELAEADALWRTFAPDLVVIEDIALSRLLTLAPKHGARTIIDLHNIDSRKLEDTVRAAPLWQRLRSLRRNRLRIGKARDSDTFAAGAADQVWVCSEMDRATLLALGPARDVRVIANPIPRVPPVTSTTWLLKSKGVFKSREVFMVGSRGFCEQHRLMGILLKNGAAGSGLAMTHRRARRGQVLQ